MAYQEFDGELDKPTEFAEFTGELDAPAQDAPEVVTSARPWRGAGAGRGSAQDPRRLDTQKQESVLQGVQMDEPKFDAAEAERLSNRAYAQSTPASRSAPSMTEFKGRMGPSDMEQLGAGLSDTGIIGRGMAKAVTGGVGQLGGLVRAAGDVTGLNSVSAFGQSASAGANAIDAGIGEAKPFADFAPGSVTNYMRDMSEGAISSLAQSLALGTAFGAKAALPIMGILQSGDSYDKARNAGLDPAMALANAVPMGAFEVLGEKFTGTDKMLKGIGTLMTKGSSAAAKQEAATAIMTAGVKEVPGELLTYLGQTGVDLLPGVGINPNLTMKDFLDGLRDTAVQSAIMGAGVGTAGAVAKRNIAPTQPSAFDLAKSKGFLVPMSERTPEAPAAPATVNFTDPSGPVGQAGITPVVVPIRPNPNAAAPNVGTPSATGDVAAGAADGGSDLPAGGVGNAGLAPVVPTGVVSDPAASAPAGTNPAPVRSGAGESTSAVNPVARTSDADLLARVPKEEAQPEEIVMRRGGGGYGTQADAQAAVASKQVARPELDWRVEPMENGRFRIAGYTQEASNKAAEPANPNAKATTQAAVATTSQENTNGNPATTLRNTNVAGDAGSGGAGNAGQAVAAGVPGVADQAGRAVPPAVAGAVGDAAAARATAQVALDRAHARDPARNPKVNLGKPSAVAERQLTAAAQQTAKAFGVGGNVVIFEDTSEDSANGFERDGVVYLNTKGLTNNATNTGWHETHHVLQGIAEADDAGGKTNTPAQRYRDQVDGLFDGMSEAGKRSYVTNFLHAEELSKLDGPAKEKRTQELMASRITRREMVADFVGNRATDREFIKSLSKADPVGFKDFAKKWLKVIDNLIQQLRGNSGSTESAAVDKYVADLNKSRMVLRNAMVELRKSGEMASDSGSQKPASFSMRQGQQGVVGEVAPNPDAPIASEFDAMNGPEKVSATRDIGRRVAQRVFDLMGLRGWDTVFSTGTYEGKTNPNFILTAPAMASQSQIDEVARAIGFVLDQKAMVTFNEKATTGDNVAGFVKVVLPEGMPDSKLSELRKWIADKAPQAGGDTLRDGALVFGNFRDENGAPFSGIEDADFRAQIRSAIEAFPDGGIVLRVSQIEQFRSELIWPDNREAYLEGTRYGESDRLQAGQSQRGDDLRGREGSDLVQLRALAEEAGGRLRQWIDSSTSGRERIRRDRELAAQNAGRQSAAVEYGTAGPNSAQAVGNHFSQQPRSRLSSIYYGTGIKGAEGNRLALPENSDIRPRIYFYVDSGSGVRPEAGVGGARHAVKLNNLYDTNADPLKIVGKVKGESQEDRASKMERAIVQAGFDGYLADTGATQKFAVLIGKHEISFSRRQMSRNPDDYNFGAGDFDGNAGNDLGNFDLDFTEDAVEEPAPVARRNVTTIPTAAAQAGPTNPNSVTAADMLKHGIFAERAFDYGTPTDEGGYLNLNLPSGFPHVSDDAISINSDGTVSMGWLGDTWLNKVSRDAGLSFARGQTVKGLIVRSGYDIASAYRKGTVQRLAQTWRDITTKSGAFRMGRSGERNMVDIASDMNAFKKYNFASSGTRFSFTEKQGRNGAAPKSFGASFNTYSDGTFDCCTMGLEGSGDLGTDFYAVASIWAMNNDKVFHADSTLSGINAYRRTEQVLSFALKTWRTDVILPGKQNRVYGYNPKASTEEEHNRNIARLALASMRNVAEVFPYVRSLRYNAGTDMFTDRNGRDAEKKVSDFLDRTKNPDAGALGFGRSTIARAVVTGQILAGDMTGLEGDRFEKPIAYSRKQPGLDSPLGESWGEKGDINPKLKEFLGDSVLQDKDGTPIAMYHGTAQDITQFRAKQAGAIFVTENPNFAMDFALASEDWMTNNYKDILTPEQIKSARTEAAAFAMSEKSSPMTNRKEMKAQIQDESGTLTGEAKDYFNKALSKYMPSNANIMPLVVRAENPFDFRKQAHRDYVIEQLFADNEVGNWGDGTEVIWFANRTSMASSRGMLESGLSEGDWSLIEEPEMQAAIRSLGHDSFYVKENGQVNLGVYEPTQIKSAIGNNGNYDREDPRISFSAKQASPLERYIDQRNRSMSRTSPQSVLDADIDLAVKAIEAASADIASGAKADKPVPVGVTPHVLGMLGWPSQMIRMDASILKKVLFDKHAEDFVDVSIKEFVTAIYRPAMVLKSANGSDVELVTNLLTSKGPIIIPVSPSTALPSGVRSASIKSAYSRNVAGGGQSLMTRVRGGAVLYVDGLTAQSSMTGRPAAQEGINALKAQFSLTPPSGRQANNVADAQLAVKPLNPNYVGWSSVRDIIMGGISSRKIKTDVDLMKWIGNNYKPGSSAAGWDDAPSFSRKQQRAPGMPEESRFMSVRRKLQDQFIQVKVLQDMLTARGGTVGEAQNVYRAEERMHGRGTALMTDFANHQIKPFIDKVAKYKLDINEVALYAYALHAKERNNYIKSINPKIGDAGSGMSDDEADTIVQLAALSGDQAAFDDLQQDLMGITSTTRRVLLDEGLITQDEYDGWSNLYANYVPLRGFEGVDAETGKIRPGVGRGYSITGKESIKALGRNSKAGHILENIIRDYERAVARSERNAVAKTFLDLATSNPDPALWEIQPVKYTPSFNKASGMVLMRKADDTGEDTIAIKVAGQSVRVKINDELVLRAMKLAAKDETSQLERLLADTLGTYTNLMRNTLTRYNPVFGAINAVRDGQMGAVSTFDELGARGMGLYMKHFPAALAASWRSERDKPGNGPMDRAMMEMRFAGGSTGGFHTRNLDEITETMQEMLLAAGSTPKTKMEWVKSTKPYQLAKWTMKWLEIVGSTSEDAARVAGYRAARDMGKTPGEAASISKNLTTNFNRKGEWGQTLNSLYLFFNAGVQGSVRVIEALGNPKVRYMMAGATAAAMAIALANAGAGDDDDEQAYWDKIPDFEKERNLIFMLPPGAKMDGAKQVGKNGRYIKIPMPYGLNIFAVLGNAMADMARYAKDPSRGKKPAKAAINIVSAVFGSMNPFGGSLDLTNFNETALAVLPTALDLPFQLGTGVNSFGRPVGPEKSPFDNKPDSENFSARQAGTASQYVARWLNSVTGGNEARSGGIDVMPGTIDNLVRNTTGGLGVFVADTFVNLPTKLFSPVETTTRDVPLWRNFYGGVDDVTDMGLFYDRRAEVTKVFKDAQNEMKLGIDVEYDKESVAKQGLGKAAESYTQWMTKLRKEEVRIAADESMSRGEKMVARKEIEKQRAQIAQSFNQLYNESTREAVRAK